MSPADPQPLPLHRLPAHRATAIQGAHAFCGLIAGDGDQAACKRDCLKTRPRGGKAWPPSPAQGRSCFTRRAQDSPRQCKRHCTRFFGRRRAKPAPPRFWEPRGPACRARGAQVLGDAKGHHLQRPPSTATSLWRQAQLRRFAAIGEMSPGKTVAPAALPATSFRMSRLGKNSQLGVR